MTFEDMTVRTFDDIGVQVPRLMLPVADVDLTRWAVVACDQFTSAPEYWHDVERLVDTAPSTLNLILPEIFLGRPDTGARVRRVQETMQAYVDGGTLRPHTGFVHVERRVDGRTRRGIVLAVDLDRYEYERNSTSLIRATEGTILERLPPRVELRKGAVLELPHVMLLIDDPADSVMDVASSNLHRWDKLYDFELMLGSGYLTGRAIPQDVEQEIARALRDLAEPTAGARRGTDVAAQRILFAVGDGNHSLAAAKAIWEQMRPNVSPAHPARYALVEVVNVHDSGLHFEPIHRLLFGLRREVIELLRGALGDRVTYRSVADASEMIGIVDERGTNGHSVGVVGGGQSFGVVSIAEPPHRLAVGTLQPQLDQLLSRGDAASIDYVHGSDAVIRLGSQAGNAGFYLPAMPKAGLFRTIQQDGVLPRKTFSMGAAKEKRFYMEARRIASSRPMRPAPCWPMGEDL